MIIFNAICIILFDVLVDDTKKKDSFRGQRVKNRNASFSVLGIYINFEMKGTRIRGEFAGQISRGITKQLQVSVKRL